MDWCFACDSPQTSWHTCDPRRVAYVQKVKQGRCPNCAAIECGLIPPSIFWNCCEGGMA